MSNIVLHHIHVIKIRSIFYRGGKVLHPWMTWACPDPSSWPLSQVHHLLLYLFVAASTIREEDDAVLDKKVFEDWNKEDGEDLGR